MIIKFPTALYASVIPTVEDVGNVSWLISSNDPPRPSAAPIPLQLGESSQPLPPRTNSPADRLVALGELVFALSFGTTREVGVGAKAFEVGELLDFEAEDGVTQIDGLNVPDVVDVQQNTNMLDLVGAGLTQDEADDLVQSAQTKFDELMNSLNDIKTTINDKKVQIQDTQRLLNEAIKATNAAIQVFGGTDNVVVTKLTNRQSELVKQRDSLVVGVNNLSAQAQTTYDDLIKIKEVVR